MALKSTVYRAELLVNDIDRHYYGSHALTLARHPSETDERLMVRVLAFALNASQALTFGRGLSTDDEPDLWRKDLTGAIQSWIAVGLPEVKLLRRAAGRSEQVAVYAYGRGTDAWWMQNRRELERLDKLSVFKLSIDASQALAEMAQRSMQLQCMIHDGEVSLSGDASAFAFALESLKRAR